MIPFTLRDVPRSMLPANIVAALDWCDANPNRGLYVRKTNSAKPSAPKRTAAVTTPTIAAVHEAGHCAAAFIANVGIVSATIKPSDGQLSGQTITDREDFDRASQLEKAAIACAGAAAESKFTCRRCELSRSDELRLDVAALNCGPRGYQNMLTDGPDRAAKVVDAMWPEIQAVARELTARGTLTGKEVQDIILARK